MAGSHSKTKGEAESQATTNTAEIHTTLTTAVLPPPRRPDLTRIRTETLTITLPSSSSALHPRRESDQISYSASTASTSASAQTRDPKDTSSGVLRNPSIQIPGLDILKTMTRLELLSQAEEDDLHAKRLLNIEEKPFKRIQKRLLAPTNPIQEYLRRRPVDANTATTNKNGSTISDEETPSQNEDSPTSPTDPGPSSQIQQSLKTLESFRHATLHDFSALTTSLARLQFLLTSNTKERDRYATQATNISEQHTSTRENTTSLRLRLSEARDQLQARKEYDVLAEKVLYVNGKVGGEKAKTREELTRDSDRLRSEIEELEREGEDLQSQWRDRRQALGNVIVEAGRLRRVVHGEPEQVETEIEIENENENEVEEDKNEDGRSDIPEGEDAEDGEEKTTREDEDDNLLGVTDREGATSNVGTPRPMDDGGSTPMPNAGESGALTPLPTTQESGGMTPWSTAGDEDVANGSGLKNEVSGRLEDAEMVEPQVAGVPELKVGDADKAEIEVDVSEMDTS